jgi:hypothetical protein
MAKSTGFDLAAIPMSVADCVPVNAVRLHSTLVYLSPAAYETKLTVKEPTCLSEIT